jgi:hypothetical protein
MAVAAPPVRETGVPGLGAGCNPKQPTGMPILPCGVRYLLRTPRHKPESERGPPSIRYLLLRVLMCKAHLTRAIKKVSFGVGIFDRWRFQTPGAQLRLLKTRRLFYGTDFAGSCTELGGL